MALAPAFCLLCRSPALAVAPSILLDRMTRAPISRYRDCGPDADQVKAPHHHACIVATWKRGSLVVAKNELPQKDRWPLLRPKMMMKMKMKARQKALESVLNPHLQLELSYRRLCRSRRLLLLERHHSNCNPLVTSLLYYHKDVDRYLGKKPSLWSLQEVHSRMFERRKKEWQVRQGTRSSTTFIWQCPS